MAVQRRSCDAVSALGSEDILGQAIGVCRICSKPMELLQPRQVMCSDACRAKHKARFAGRKLDMKCGRCGVAYQIAYKDGVARDYKEICPPCKTGLWHLNNRKPVKNIRHNDKPFNLPCGSCEYARVTRRTETGYLCNLSALECNPWYAARLFEPIQEAT